MPTESIACWLVVCDVLDAGDEIRRRLLTYTTSAAVPAGGSG